MFTCRIHITGRVQGVGFRPAVWNLANKLGIKGTVENSGKGVVIFAQNNSKSTLIEFYNQIKNEPPHLSIIRTNSIEFIDQQDFNGFEIVESVTASEIELLLSPDFGICSECRKDLLDPTNRRFQYPFITCTKCGPRYSITYAIPYDRERTKMDAFSMCSDCKDEYGNVTDRRFYSQTNSCAECGIELTVYSKHGQQLALNQNEIIEFLRKVISEKEAIVAIKGLGGYLLICDATSENAISKLRLRKHRPLKPFAVMYPSIKAMKRDVRIKDIEQNLLSSVESPIVLLPLLENPASGILAEKVAPGLGKIGAMLPYTGLYELILNGINKPIIATSANMTNAPIIYNDKQAINELVSLADYIVPNNRAIVMPQDDSVVQLSTNNQPIFIRRSRGYAPSFSRSISLKAKDEILAFGAELKASFSFLNNKEVYSSQYLGNLSSYDSQESFKHSLFTVQKMLNAKPTVVICDLHPDYASTHLAREFAQQHDQSLYKVQHHEAHFAAVIEENELWESDHPVLGVIWDGTGYGADANIWGGEFFDYHKGKISRISHIEYFKHFAHDQFSKQCRLPLLSLLNPHKSKIDIDTFFSKKEFQLFSKLKEKSQLWTSSMGRVFDAVAALLRLTSFNQYEGLAPLLLEQHARKYLSESDPISPYPIEINIYNPIPLQKVISFIIKDLDDGKGTGYCAAKFHVTLSELVWQMANMGGYKKIAFSGGVLQNALLVDLIIDRVAPDINLYFHRELSPNDENISFGQIAHYIAVNKDLKSTGTEKN